MGGGRESEKGMEEKKQKQYKKKKFVNFSPLMYNIKCSLNDDLRPQKEWKSSSSLLSLSIWLGFDWV